MAGPAIGLVCRPPRLSRGWLEPVVGAERSFALARAMLEDSVALGEEVARRETGRLTVFHAPAETGTEMAELLPGVALHPLAGADPDVWREQAAAHLFALGHAPVVLLGMATPTLPPALLELLFDALRSGADAGCIPDLDGGYCAVGLARPLPALVRGLPWSGPGLLAATRAKVQAEGLTFRELQPWHGMGEDLTPLRTSLDGLAPATCSPLPPFAAPATRAVLA